MIWIDEQIACHEFPCIDIQHSKYMVPGISIDPKDVSTIIISEAAPQDPNDYYYAGVKSHYELTTVHAFNQAGVNVANMEDFPTSGVYLTTAVKCGKRGYRIKAKTIKECSLFLEVELSLFTNVCSILWMGDVATKAINYIAKRAGEPRPIPAGSTYIIRGGE